MKTASKASSIGKLPQSIPPLNLSFRSDACPSILPDLFPALRFLL